MTEKPRQLSRVAGVPRLKLPIWKAAAAQFFGGKEPSREEQQNKRRKSKVALLRELAASDPKVKSWVIEFATDMRARAARETAAEQGFKMPETLGFMPLFPGDRPDLTVMARTVICMEKPNADELLEKLQTLYPDGDPPEVVERLNKEWAAFAIEMKRREVPATPTCNWCAGPWTRILNGVHYCEKHDGKPTASSPAVPVDPSPAAFNADFGKAPADPTGRIAALQALRQAQEDAAAFARRHRADYGPTKTEEK